MNLLIQHLKHLLRSIKNDSIKVIINKIILNLFLIFLFNLKKKIFDRKIKKINKKINLINYQIYKTRSLFLKQINYLITNKSFNYDEDMDIILGNYELPIHKIFNNFKIKFPLFINIGSDIGYYGCILNKNEIAHNIINVDINKAILDDMNNLYDMNFVDRPKFFKSMHEIKLEEKLQNKRFLILIDIEGNEFTEINDLFLQKFKKSLIIFEWHRIITMKNFYMNEKKLIKNLEKYFNIHTVFDSKSQVDIKDLNIFDNYILSSSRRNIKKIFKICIPKKDNLDIYINNKTIIEYF